jgi:hypothetical protein
MPRRSKRPTAQGVDLVQVVDSTNFIEFAKSGKVEDYKPPEKVEAKAEEAPKVEDKAAPAAADDELSEDEKAAKVAMGSKKWDQVIGRRHRAQKEAEERGREAESFAENQYRERLAAERRAEELEARLKALESKAQPEVSDKEPKPEDFKTPEEYWNARIDWKAAKAVADDRALRAEEERQREETRLNEARIARNAAFAKDHADYEDVVEEMGRLDLQVPRYISDYLMKSEDSASVMYHWGKNPDVLKGILKLPPDLALSAIGKLEAKLEKVETKADEPVVEPKPADTLRSRAPAPITPVSANGAGTVHKDLKDMTTRETIEYWAARDKASSHKRQRH